METKMQTLMSRGKNWCFLDNREKSIAPWNPTGTMTGIPLTTIHKWNARPLPRYAPLGRVEVLCQEDTTKKERLGQRSGHVSSKCQTWDRWSSLQCGCDYCTLEKGSPGLSRHWFTFECWRSWSSLECIIICVYIVLPIPTKRHIKIIKKGKFMAQEGIQVVSNLIITGSLPHFEEHRIAQRQQNIRGIVTEVNKRSS